MKTGIVLCNSCCYATLSKDLEISYQVLSKESNISSTSLVYNGWIDRGTLESWVYARFTLCLQSSIWKSGGDTGKKNRLQGTGHPSSPSQ